MKWFKRIGTLVGGPAHRHDGVSRRAIRTSRCRIVVAYQAGQGTDVVTRYIAEQLTKALGQSFFVENRGGAGGNIGTEAAARAAADGYTLTMGTNATHALNQFLYATLPFNAEKDFEPIILVGTFPMVVARGRRFADQVDRRPRRARQGEPARRPTSRCRARPRASSTSC